MYKYNKIRFRQQILLVARLIAICVFLSGCIGKKPKVYRVGIVSGVDAFASIADGFRAKMGELGYVEGKNIIYDFQRLTADRAGEERVVKKFVADKVDLIFAFPTEPALAAKAATRGTNIPVVFAISTIEETNLIEKVHLPGGNITGVRFPGPESTVKRLEILHELVPQAKRVYLIYNQDYPAIPIALEGLRLVSSSLGITLVEDTVNNLEELKSAIEKRAASGDIGIDAILIMPDILTHSANGFATILEFSNKHKVPIGGCMGFMADLGALFSFFPDNIETGQLAAGLVDKIFEGTPAGTIMVVTPESHLRLNYKVIKELGLNVPEGLLSRADEIIR
jgi:putative ABC transport system substrate-binding protein